jgi:assimilatory nitrate reductase catalytic subunit
MPMSQEISSLLPANETLNKEASLISSTCPYCGVGCGVDVNVTYTSEEHAECSKVTLSALSGTKDHPANFGRLCVKGSKLLATNGTNGRMEVPKINGKSVGWPSAIAKVADTFNAIISQYGPDAVAFYVSGQLLTEDYYVANKLMKGYIGSANIDTNSRLCMSSAVTAYKRAFGADAVPCCYEDLELTDLLVLVGSNAAWTHPVLYQRIERAKLRNPAIKVVLIDPRKTATSELADLHLSIKAGSDVALFNGLLTYLANNNGLNQHYIQQFTEGFEQALTQAETCTINQVAELCDIEQHEISQFYALFKQHDKVLTAYSMGVNQSTSGVDKANAIINCHLATGKLGREGCGPFSLTGQPNAMGGREVGGLANMLTCHMELDNPQHRKLVQNYWRSPTIATSSGLRAVDLFDEINEGKIKAVWIMATNPVVSMPNRDKIIAALKKCELVVVSDCVANNDTLELAHVTLPAAAWSEKNGTVTNSERRISRQRGLMPPFAEAKHDWQIICDVAQAMGFTEGFAYQHVQQIFCEYAGLTSQQNNGSRALDLSALSQLSIPQYDSLRPLQWPITLAKPQGTTRLFEDGRFYTKSTKAQFMALAVHKPEQQTTEAFPFALNSGRIRDQWHTMTRTGKSSELSAHISQPTLSMHPEDACKLNLRQNDFVELAASHSSEMGRVILALKLDDKQRKGEIFAPIHWSGANASHAAISSLYTDANDALSGQPELKHAAVSVKKVNYAWQGQLFIKYSLNVTLLRRFFDYFVVTTGGQGDVVNFATNRSLAELKQNLQQNLPRNDEWVSAQFGDQNNFYALCEGKLNLVVFAANYCHHIDENWVTQLLEQPTLSELKGHALLHGEVDEDFMTGPIVCSCFKVGQNTIKQAIGAGCNSVDALGGKLKCGTNCGSCKSELGQLVKKYQGDISKGRQTNKTLDDANTSALFLL